MIISTTTRAVRSAVNAEPGAGATAAWSCLVRRGMLHSECEAVEHWVLEPGAVLSSTPQHGVEEALLVLEGELALTTEDSEHAVRAGQLVLLPHGAQARLVAGRTTVRLISVRVLAAPVTDRLPPRVPELVPS
ncbi:cupin domain-containing protein [Streptomyces longwoodensis]|uniref:cupin domain-containing protein n=1 Tax=Streptomyces longwoodensis TaxID=68231 RepID=UPI0033AE4E0C